MTRWKTCYGDAVTGSVAQWQQLKGLYKFYFSAIFHTACTLLVRVREPIWSGLALYLSSPYYICLAHTVTVNTHLYCFPKQGRKPRKLVQVMVLELLNDSSNNILKSTNYRAFCVVPLLTELQGSVITKEDPPVPQCAICPLRFQAINRINHEA